MFERAMLHPAPVRRWAFSIGMAGEAVVVGGALLAPLIWPQILPRAEVITSILSPPAPVAAFKPVQPTPARPVRAWSNAALFYRRTAAWPTTATVNDLPAPDVMPGAGDGSGELAPPLTGFLDSVVRPSTPSRPVAAVLPAKPAPETPSRIRVSGPVQAARLVHRVEPSYPLAAQQLRISGTVELSGVIGVDGRIRELHVTSGNPWLAQAALEAVRQWIYQPTLLGGKPVEVQTSIQVNFRLR